MALFPWSNLSFAEAISYFEEQREIDTETWKDILGHEQDAVFVVAGAKGALLSDLRELVEEALTEGKTRDQFINEFDDIISRLGWSFSQDRDWRANLIYQTNIRTAYGRGREEQIQRVKARRPFAQWRHGGTASRDFRPEHLAMDRKVFLIDERPTRLPYGYGCICQWFTLRQADLDRLDLEVTDPSTVSLPDEPGWTRSLDTPSSQMRAEILANVTNRLDPDIRDQAIEEATGP